MIPADPTSDALSPALTKSAVEFASLLAADADKPVADIAKLTRECMDDLGVTPRRIDADPASSERADARKEQAARIIREIAEEEKARDADRAESIIARCNLIFLEERCRYSLGLAGDLTGDALTKAVGDKVIAMRDETATLRAALEKIADTSNWSTDQKVQIAVDALANLKAPTP